MITRYRLGAMISCHPAALVLALIRPSRSLSHAHSPADGHIVRRLPVLLLVGLAASACATAGPAIPASSLSACAAPGAEKGWREVVAEAVRFCVPPTWTSEGRRAWRGPEGALEWSSTPARREVGSTTTVVTGVGGRPPSGEQVQVQVREDLRAREVYRGRESIHGRTVEVYIMQDPPAFDVGGTWTSPMLSMAGTAPSLEAAEVLLEVIRTARAPLRQSF